MKSIRSTVNFFVCVACKRWYIPIFFGSVKYILVVVLLAVVVVVVVVVVAAAVVAAAVVVVRLYVVDYTEGSILVQTQKFLIFDFSWSVEAWSFSIYIYASYFEIHHPQLSAFPTSLRIIQLPLATWSDVAMSHHQPTTATACRHIQTKKDERNYFTLSSTFNFPEVSRSTLITRRSKSARSNSSLPLTLRAISNPVTAACTDNNTFHFSGSRCTLFNMKYSIIFFKIFHM